MENLPLKDTMKKTRKNSKKKIVIILLIIIFGFMLGFSLTMIVNYFEDNKENREIQKIISNAITVTPNENEKYKVDFKELKKQNPDTVAYLKVNNTNIEYVVVKGNNNDFYLNHNFTKKFNVSGWIFADYHNKFDGSDRNIIIYGHNTQDGSMFGTLKNTLNEEWYSNKKNHKIMLVTTEGLSYYEVFSVYTIETEEYYINTEFNSDEEFETFIKRLKFRSVYPFEVNVSKLDKILTLSSCTVDGTKRVVLHAKLMN